MLGREVVRAGSIPSTMDLVDRYARDGAAEGLVVVADEQTAGRGRSGRTWHAALGSSLLCSILLRPSLPASQLGPLPLLAGVAVAETIEQYVDARVGLKWPNDVLIDGRKLAGLLMQSRVSASGVDFVNLGIGINVSAPIDDLPVGAISINAAGGSTDRDAVLQTLLIQLEPIYRTFLDLPDAPNLAAWRDRAVMLGERVTVAQAGESIAGRFVDVADDGRLMLALDSGETILLAQGDVERGPRSAQP